MHEPVNIPEFKSAPLVPGTLYLVATPIGNMEDITLRAIRTLRDCDLVAAEDTRHTGMLLKRLGLAKRQVSTHKFNEARRSGEIVEFNDSLEDEPEKVNDDPYGEGWMIKVKLSDPSEVDSLLTAEQYQEVIGS